VKSWSSDSFGNARNALECPHAHLQVSSPRCFTNRPLQGNQLAVFPDAANLEPVLMQSIALEMAFSETTFVLPPETSDTHARVRIFTPRDEIPMAAIRRSAQPFALAHEGTLAPEQKSITLGLGIGPTLVRLEWKAGRLHFAWMTQPIPEFGAIPANTGDLAAALGIKEADIRDTGPARTGRIFGTAVSLCPDELRDAVNRAELERGAYLRFCRAAGLDELPVFLFLAGINRRWGHGIQPNVRSRFWRYGRCWDGGSERSAGRLPGPPWRSLDRASCAHGQPSGCKDGRPSEIHISIAARDGKSPTCELVVRPYWWLKAGYPCRCRLSRRCSRMS